jgi:transposase-like protein
MRDWAAELVERARSEGVDPTSEDGPLTALVRQVLQTGLEVEMTDHVGYKPHAVEGRGSGNSRNGSYPKTVRTEIGKVDLQVPRDRNGTFEPVTVRKGERRLEGLAGNVISLCRRSVATDLGVGHKIHARSGARPAAGAAATAGSAAALIGRAPRGVSRSRAASSRRRGE